MSAQDPVQDKYVMLNGLRFHYRDWPNPGGPALLMLHGFSNHARGLDTLAKGLQDSFRVLVVDQRGHGETGWASDYAWERWIEDIDGFVGALGLSPIILLGHSMGGAHANRYAGLHPESVNKLVIVDEAPNAQFSPEFPEKWTQLLPSDVFSEREEIVRTWQTLWPRISDSGVRNLIYNNTVQRADGRWTYRYDAWLRAPNAPQQWPHENTAWEIFSKITCPTLIVRAANSEYLSEANVDQMLRALPHAEVVEIPNTGHAIPWEDPEGLIAVVRRFLLEPAAH